MPIGTVWIYRLLFVCLFVFVRLRISPPRIKLAVSNFARRFIGVQGTCLATEAHSDSMEFTCAIQKTLMYVCM